MVVCLYILLISAYVRILKYYYAMKSGNSYYQSQFKVDGVHRVAIFASKPILANDELLYNYGYDDTQRMHFVPKEIKRHSNSNANPN